jgi:hypothetical protein
MLVLLFWHALNVGKISSSSCIRIWQKQTSLGGGKYVLTSTDDATNHEIVFILANKNASTVLKAFKEYQASAERQSGYKIKEIRTDPGTEYMGEMMKYVKSQGIEYNPTAGYSPQSNGLAERINRTLFDMACTMLNASGDPLELWGEAVLASAHIRNRLPTGTLDRKTPHEAWTSRKPTIGHIRKWGCKVHRHINKKTGRKKLDKKSMIGFLVGYESGNIYHIYHPWTKEFKVSQDVIFLEKQHFNTKHVKDTETHDLNYDGTLTWDESDASDAAASSDAQESWGQLHDEIPTDDEAPMPIIYDEIVVQPLPAPQKSIESHLAIESQSRVNRESIESQSH